MPPNPPHTPLRRLSQGSLFRLSRSEAYPDAPHGLGFLEPALAELIDEAEALQTNVEGLRNLDAALDTFNESFASWLYVMNMNALTTDWPQVRLNLYRTVMRTKLGRSRRAAGPDTGLVWACCTPSRCDLFLPSVAAGSDYMRRGRCACCIGSYPCSRGSRSPPSNSSRAHSDY